MASILKVKNPMKTRNDKVRLSPLSITQLGELLQKSGKKKDKAKIQRRLGTIVIRDINNHIKKLNKALK